MLFRPVGPKELELIKASGWKVFPPRLPDQPIFYPVTNQAYAAQIARDWNVRASGAGFVTRFAMKAEYLARFQVQKVGHTYGILDPGGGITGIQCEYRRAHRSD